MVDKAALGITGTPFEMDIERGKIHEFARATRSTHPAHFTGDQPVIPPTFLTTLGFKFGPQVVGDDLADKAGDFVPPFVEGDFLVGRE